MIRSKRILIGLMIFACLFIIFISGCAIKDLIEVVNDPDPLQNPNWEFELIAPAIDKTFILNDYYPAGFPPAITIPDLPTNYGSWPTAGVINTFVPIPNMLVSPPIIDFNNDSVTDVTITHFYSTNAKITLILTLENSLGTQLDLAAADFGLITVRINGVDYTLSFNRKSGLSLIYESTDFFSAAEEYIISSTLDFDGAVINLLATSPAYTDINTPYTLKSSLSMDLGSSASVVGSIPADIKIGEIPIPFQSIPVLQLETLGLDMQSYSHLPVQFQFFMDTSNLITDSGVLQDKAPATLPLYKSVASEKTSTGQLRTNYSGGDITFGFWILQSGATPILINRYDYVRYKINLYGKLH